MNYEQRIKDAEARHLEFMGKCVGLNTSEIKKLSIGAGYCLRELIADINRYGWRPDKLRRKEWNDLMEDLRQLEECLENGYGTKAAISKGYDKARAKLNNLPIIPN